MMMLLQYHQFLVFLLTLGVALTAVAAPLRLHTVGRAPQALVNTDERRATSDAECSLDPRINLPSITSDALSAEVCQCLLDSVFPEVSDHSGFGFGFVVGRSDFPGPSGKASVTAHPVIVEARSDAGQSKVTHPGTTTPPTHPGPPSPPNSPVFDDSHLLNGHRHPTTQAPSPPIVDGSHPPNGHSHPTTQVSSPPSPPVVDGSHTLSSHTILNILSSRNQAPTPETVHDLFKTSSLFWDRDIARSQLNLTRFIDMTENGKLYNDTAKLINQTDPGFDQVELEAKILLDLFLAHNSLEGRSRAYWSLTKNAYTTLTELRTYEHDTRTSHDWTEFETTRSGRLFQAIYVAVHALKPNYRTYDLQFYINQDIRGLTDTVDKASDVMRRVFNKDWDVETRKFVPRLKKGRLRAKWKIGKEFLMAGPSRVFRKAKNMYKSGFSVEEWYSVSSND
ncbi:hypothetical protein EV360DRAFT_88501 [Lentinula raphanica]|nr:hypothetical protein EV360DRAFT_88501 [Lentinula raphanica]